MSDRARRLRAPFTVRGGAISIALVIGTALVTFPADTSAAKQMATSGVVAWGGNEFGQLGIEPEPSPGLWWSKNGPESCATRSALGNPIHVACSRTPVSVPGLADVTAVEGEGDGEASYSVALLANGTVVEWGRARGVAGTGPIPVSGLSGVKSVSRGLQRGVALLRDGTVMEWSEGVAPKPVVGLEGVRAIAPHGAAGAVLRNGTVVIWGGGTLIPVDGIQGARSVAFGGCCALAVLRNGTVMGWGSNLSGCLGAEVQQGHPPIQLANVTNVAAVAIGGPGPTTHCFALLRNGTVEQLGYHGPEPIPGLDHVKAISAASQGALSLALRRNGTVVAFQGVFGTAAEGAFGDGPAEEVDGLVQPLPLPVSNLTHATAIAAAGTLVFEGDVAEDAYGLAAWARPTNRY